MTSAANLRTFLDPFDSETNSWTNDTNTLKASDGVIYVMSYNAAGRQTDTKVKKGRTGTAYYVSAADYGDGDGDSSGEDHANGTLPIAQYEYPTQTTTRNDGKKTTYSYTFWDSDDTLFKTRTTTLPVISSGQNGSGNPHCAQNLRGTAEAMDREEDILLDQLLSPTKQGLRR